MPNDAAEPTAEPAADASRVATETTTTEIAKVGDVQESKAVTVRERLITTSDVAIWDTAALEHMGRVGAIMADSGLGSPTIFMQPIIGPDGKATDKFEPVPRGMAVARCVMIANAARDAGADPLMFMQTVSIISGKMHLEGKTVNAIIRKRTGVVLRFEFGLWDFDHIVFPERNEDGTLKDPAFFNKAEDRLAVRAFDPEDPERWVEGSVGLWKTTRTGSPWSNAGNHRRQLRYRAAPEWARAYEPGAVLGIYSDADEDLDGFDAPTTTAPRAKRNLKAALQEGAANASDGAGAADTGFDRNHVADETGEDRKGAAEDVTCDHEFEKIGDDDRVCKHCGVLEEDVVDLEERDETPEISGGAAQGSAALDAAGDDLETDAAFLADLSGEETAVVLSRLEAAAKAGDKLAENPQPEPGETYLLAGDAFTGKDKRRVNYKDGVAFSSCGAQGAAKLKVYGIHAEVPDATEAKPEAEAEPEAAAGDTTTGDPVADMVAAKFGEMEDWPTIKAAWAVMCKTTDWVGASPSDQDAIRRAAWPLLARLKVDQATDITAFGIWMPTQKGQEGADAITGTFNVLKASEVWAKLSPAQMETLEARVATTVASLK